MKIFYTRNITIPRDKAANSPDPEYPRRCLHLGPPYKDNYVDADVFYRCRFYE